MLFNTGELIRLSSRCYSIIKPYDYIVLSYCSVWSKQPQSSIMPNHSSKTIVKDLDNMFECQALS